jgi:hypothetical protein
MDSQLNATDIVAAAMTSGRVDGSEPDHDVLERITALSPLDRFFYFVDERHKIYLRRQAGQPKPWTADPILREFYFTNVYRELDKTTVWFRENVRDPLRDDPRVVFATVAFRWFNLIATGEVLKEHGWLTEWDEPAVLAELGARRDLGEQLFTGAFMINSPPGEPKLEAICQRISNVWSRRKGLTMLARSWMRMAEAHTDLKRYDGLGGFMAYEIVCDLRYTSILEHASDTYIWSNPGPGAIRGLYRVLGREIKNKSNAACPPVPKDWEQQTRQLLALLQERHPTYPPFEMREVEQVLCEVDKYVRLLLREGKAKRTYAGGQ